MKTRGWLGINDTEKSADDGNKTQQSIEQKEDKPLEQKQKRTSRIEALKEENKRLAAQINELTLLLKRVQADFENYKKHAEKERQETIKFASKQLIANFLPILDTFDAALKTSNDDGIKLIYSQLWQMLEAQGLKPIEALNQKFDPFKHEALLKEISDAPENTVLEEFQKGYTFNGSVIRCSKVKVSVKETTNKNEGNNNKINTIGKSANAC